MITALIGCASVPNNQSAIDTLNKPLLVVIDDPRNERQRRDAVGNGYNAPIDYDSDPALSRVTRELAKDYNLVVSAQWPINSLGVHCFVIESPANDVLTSLKQDVRVKWIQPFNQHDVKGEFLQPDSSPAATELEPTLPSTNQSQSKGKGINIVVVDTGVDYNHPALKDSDLSYKNFVERKGMGHAEMHGTAVVGLIAAQPSNNLGVPTFTGFAPEASVHHFRGCWQDNSGKGKCNTLTLALALDAAVAVKPDLVNLSLSGPADLILEKIIGRLIADGSIVVSAFDEKRAQHERFPNAQQGVFYAYGIHDTIPENIPENSLFAPANALSLAPNGQYDVFTGHSIATPHLTALAANFIADNPNSSHNDIANHLKQWLTNRYQMIQ